MSEPKALETLGFDRYQRFRAAAGLINGLAQGRGLAILDVGPFDDAFAAFLPGHRVQGHSGLVRPGSGLPMADGVAEVVCALDVLEHVAPPERAFFLAELARVASLAVVLGFPIAPAAAAEEFVWRVTQSPWLAEHRRHGLPEPAEVEAMLDGLGLAWERHPNAALPSWTAMMLLMYGVRETGLREEISAFFNRRYYELENREPAYRYLYLCRKPGRGGDA
ncbi:MAG: hypothetical protein ACOZHQ_06450 [Thermodesulfobacteriota bacterium]